MHPYRNGLFHLCVTRIHLYIQMIKQHGKQTLLLNYTKENTVQGSTAACSWIPSKTFVVWQTQDPSYILYTQAYAFSLGGVPPDKSS